MPKLLRITTVPISLKLLIKGQMKFMSENGFEVLMTSGDGVEVNEVVQAENCELEIVPFTRKISPFLDLKCLFCLIKIIKKFKPDIVHTHTPKAGLIGMLAAKICGVKLKLHTVAGLPLFTANGFKYLLLRYTEIITYWASDYTLPNSISLMDYIKENKLVNSKKLHIICKGSSNGIDLNRFSQRNLNTKRLVELKDEIAFDENSFYLLTVGRVVRDKGIIELIRAFNSLEDKYPRLRLIILGPIEDQRTEESIPQSILDEIIRNNKITHIDWSDEVEYYMEICDLLIHPSHREGFPNVLLQAGAMMLPILCSNIPGNIDIVDHNKTGQLFKKGKQISLETGLDNAINNYKDLNDLAENLKAKIERDFSTTTIHNNILNFYNLKLDRDKK